MARESIRESKDKRGDQR